MEQYNFAMLLVVDLNYLLICHADESSFTLLDKQLLLQVCGFGTCNRRSTTWQTL